MSNSESESKSKGLLGSLDVNWEFAPPDLIELRKLILDLDPQNISLHFNAHQFANALLTENNSDRVIALMQILRLFHTEDEFWTLEEPENILLKCIWTCTILGLEEDPEIIKGKRTMKENLQFWLRIMNKLTILEEKNRSELRKKGIHFQLNEDDATKTWDEIIKIAYEQAYAEKKIGQVVGDGEFSFNIDDVLNLDKLHRNGMTNTHTMEQLKSVVQKSLKGLMLPEEFMDQSHQKIYTEALEKAELIQSHIEEFLELMKSNNNFESKKTEFLIYFAGSLASKMDTIMELNRNFLADCVFNTTEGDEDAFPNLPEELSDL